MKSEEKKERARRYMYHYWRRVRRQRLKLYDGKLFSELTLKERFMLNVQKEPTGCWGWLSPLKNQRGKSYGKLRVGTLYSVAHRVGYQLFVGPIPKGKIVRHTCDNPNCVNPEHLLLGTTADNMKDRDERGRTAFGERNGWATLTEVQVRKIMKSKADDATLAARFGVQKAAINKVRRGRSWRHVTGLANPDS